MTLKYKVIRLVINCCPVNCFTTIFLCWAKCFLGGIGCSTLSGHWEESPGRILYYQSSIKVIRMIYCLVLFSFTSPSENKLTLHFFNQPQCSVFPAVPPPVNETTHFWNLRFHINDNSIAALQGIDAAGTTAIINSCIEPGQMVNKPIREERVTWLDAFTAIKLQKAFKLEDVNYVLLLSDVFHR